MRLMRTPRDPRGKARRPGAQSSVQEPQARCPRGAAAVQALEGLPPPTAKGQTLQVWARKEGRRLLPNSGSTGVGAASAPSLLGPLPESLPWVATGPRSAPQRATPQREGEGGRDLPRAEEWRREKKDGEGGTWPRPAVEGQAAQAPGLAGPRRCGLLRDPRPLSRGQRPRPVPCAGGRLCPGSAGGRAPARPGTAAPGGRAGGVGRAQGWRGRALPQARPTPPGPLRSPGPPQRLVYPGITCWRQPSGVPNPPSGSLGSPGPQPALVSAGTPLRRQGSGSGLPFPNESLSRANRPLTGVRAPDTQLLR